jgi:hypothetical protein
MSFFKPSDAHLYTVMADTAAARELWARVANQIFDKPDGDDVQAIEIANIAVREFTLSERDAGLEVETLHRSLNVTQLEAHEPSRRCINPPNIRTR